MSLINNRFSRRPGPIVSQLLVTLFICGSIAVLAASKESEQKRENINHSDSKLNSIKAKTNITTLITKNVMWVHEEGHVCLREDSFRSVVKVDDVVHVQEFVGDFMYTYEMVNTAALRHTQSARPSPYIGNDTWIDGLRNKKYNCVKSIAPAKMDTTSPALTKLNTDGTSVWAVNGWVIDADTNMKPTSLSAKGEYEHANFFRINTVRPCRYKIIGCKQQAKGKGRRVEEIMSYALSSETKEALQNFQNLIIEPNWCGMNYLGEDFPYPTDKNSKHVHIEHACRRHDHAIKYVEIELGGFTIPRMECKVNWDLYMAVNKKVNNKYIGGKTRNIVNAVFSPLGISGLYGCFEHGPYKCWKRFRWRFKYGNYCTGEHVRYGSKRYENKQLFWGYREKEKICEGDLEGY